MKKIGLLCLALVLALGVMGVGFALWDKTVYIEGTVNTGEVNMEVLSAASDDPSGSIDPGKDKDVGMTTAQINEDKQRVTVTVTNGYPCYEVYLHFSVQNVGTVPVRLQAINVINLNPCITVEAWDGLGEQLEPGDRRDNSMRIHVEQCADELATYTFTVEFYYVQYNEYEEP